MSEARCILSGVVHEGSPEPKTLCDREIRISKNSRGETHYSEVVFPDATQAVLTGRAGSSIRICRECVGKVSIALRSLL